MEYGMLSAGYSTDTSDDEELFAGDISDTSDDEGSDDNTSAATKGSAAKNHQAIDSKKIIAQWEEFKAQKSFAILLRRYAAHKVTEEIIQTNFILYAIGLSVYNSAAVSDVYRKKKKEILPENKITLLDAKVKERKQKIYKVLVASLRPPIANIYNAEKLKKITKIFDDFIKHNKAALLKYAEKIAKDHREFFRIKRMAKRSELSRKMQKLSAKLLDYIQEQENLAWSGSKLGKVNRTNLKTFLNQPCLLEECIRFVKKVVDEAGHDNCLGRLLDYLNNLQGEGTEAEHIIVKGELRQIFGKILELGESSSEKDESIESFITNNWDELLLDVFDQLKEDANNEKYDWFVNILKTSAYDFEVWGLIKDAIALSHEEMFDFIAAHYTAEAISNRYVEEINNAKIYTNNRGRLAGGVQLTAFPPKEHIANLRLSQRSQRRICANLAGRGIGDASTISWHIGAFEVEETLKISSVNIAQTDLVPSLGAYANKENGTGVDGKEKNNRSVLNDINNLKTALSCDDSRIAKILQYSYFGNSYAKPAGYDDIIQKHKKTISSISILIFGTEVRRYLGSIPTHVMLLQTIVDKKLSWQDALTENAASGQPADISGQPAAMPMSMVGAAPAARAMQQQFNSFFSAKYDYRASDSSTKLDTAKLMVANERLFKLYSKSSGEKRKREEIVTDLCASVAEGYGI
jgi:hypothetical protein